MALRERKNILFDPSAVARPACRVRLVGMPAGTPAPQAEASAHLPLHFSLLSVFSLIAVVTNETSTTRKYQKEK